MKKRRKKKEIIPKAVSVVIVMLLCLAFPYFYSPEIKIIDASHDDYSEEVTIGNDIWEVEYASVEYKLDQSSVFLRSHNKDSEMLAHLSSGEIVKLLAIYDDMAKAMRYNNEIGFIDLYIIPEEIARQLPNIKLEEETPDSVSNIIALSQKGETIEEKLEILKQEFQHGDYWNNKMVDVSGLPQEWSASISTHNSCSHSVNGYSFCNDYSGKVQESFDDASSSRDLGFASMVSDFLFGKSGGTQKFLDFDKVKIGDLINDITEEHIMVVIEKNEESVKVLEVNSDKESCKISWGREVDIDELNNKEIIYLTRLT